MSDTTDPDSNSSPRVYKILLMVLPIGVVIGTIIFMFAYFYMEREEERNQGVIIAHGLRVTDLQDSVDKFTDRIGERDVDTEQGRVGLKRAASMIEGRLGPQNLGLKVTKSKGKPAYGLLWKSLSVDIRGQETPEEVVFVAVSYAGKGQVADANTVSSLMMLVQAMGKEQMDRTLRFVFLPMNDASEVQNQWLADRCLEAGESCAGIIGLEVMHGSPKTGEPEWRVDAPKPADAAWWSYLSQGESWSEFTGETFPAVWMTHPVFSDATWVGNKADRLERTLEVVRELRMWLLKAAESE